MIVALEVLAIASAFVVLLWWAQDAHRAREARWAALGKMVAMLSDDTEEAVDAASWQKERLDRLMRMLEEQGVAQFPGEWGPPMLFAPPPEAVMSPADDQPQMQAAPPDEDPEEAPAP